MGAQGAFVGSRNQETGPCKIARTKSPSTTTSWTSIPRPSTPVKSTGGSTASLSSTHFRTSGIARKTRDSTLRTSVSAPRETRRMTPSEKRRCTLARWGFLIPSGSLHPKLGRTRSRQFVTRRPRICRTSWSRICKRASRSFTCTPAGRFASFLCLRTPLTQTLTTTVQLTVWRLSWVWRANPLCGQWATRRWRRKGSPATPGSLQAPRRPTPCSTSLFATPTPLSAAWSRPCKSRFGQPKPSRRRRTPQTLSCRLPCRALSRGPQARTRLAA
mmetsp:Transcript_2596/g.6141  ORF Transcript_2596/g.6141 Transcript_2596/m.6141 type:complete len:273 (-) Transcript_2596:1319-2137(-)